MIIIDADACPSIKLIENIAKKHSISVLLCADTNHILKSDYSSIKIVDEGSNSADTYIINNITKNDILVTQDYGLAVLGIAKNSHVIHPTGFIYDESNINSMLELRHINKKLRKSNIRVKGPKKRNINDDNLLIKNLEKLILLVQNN